MLTGSLCFHLRISIRRAGSDECELSHGLGDKREFQEHSAGSTILDSVKEQSAIQLQGGSCGFNTGTQTPQ
jgi:hypothetical protein